MLSGKMFGLFRLLNLVVSKNTNELKTSSPGRFGIDVSKSERMTM